MFIDELACFAIKPDIAHHAVGAGICPRSQRGVTNDCFGVGVALEGVLIDDAVRVQVTEAAITKLGVVAMGQISAELVHGDLHDKTGSLFFLRR